MHSCLSDLCQRSIFPFDCKGVKIALGTDAGGFDWKKINQAKEFEYYAQNGMPLMPEPLSPLSCSVGAKQLARSKPANGQTSWP
jgi:hypothetical protein